MYLKLYAPALAAGLSALALGGTALAAESGPNLADKPAAPNEKAQAVEQAQLAGDLAAYGRRAKSPSALILAAEIYAGVATTDETRTKTSVAEPGVPAGGPAPAPKTDKPSMSVASLLDEARALAGPDATYAPAIQRVAAMESKGRVGGPARHVDRVLAGSTDNYNVRFYGGEPARILIKGDGDTDLDLYVYDQNGNRICTDDDYTDTLVCGWTPRWTGTYQVRVVNRGRVYNNYVFLTN